MSNNPENEVKKDIKKLEERQAHLEKALDNRLQAQNDIPHIQQALDITNWQLRALQNRPPEAIEIPYRSRIDEIEVENQYLRDSYETALIESGITSTLYSATDSIITSVSPSTYDYINRIRDLGTPEAINYGNTYIQEYDHLQAAQERPNRVRMLLEKINSPNTLERFDNALTTYNKFKSVPKEKIAAATHMRNLLNGVNGDLFDRARHWPKENMTWSKMASRLAINGDRGQEHITLDNQKRIKSSLNARLSDVLKDREDGSITDLNSIWTEIIDFLFTVLGLINL